MGGNSSPTTSPRRSTGTLPSKSDTADQEQKRGSRNKPAAATSQAPNIQKVIDSCRTNFARELKKTFELDVLSDDEVLKCNGEMDAPRTRSATSLSPLGPATRSSSGGLVRSLQGGDEGIILSDENSRRLARQLWANCEKVSGDNFKTAAAAVDGDEGVHNGRMSRSRSSLLMISGGASLGAPLNQSGEVSSTSHGSSSAIPSPVDKGRNRLISKSNSAPPSPVKHVAASPKGGNDKSTNVARNNRKRSQMSGDSDEIVANKKPKLTTSLKSNTIKNGLSSNSEQPMSDVTKLQHQMPRRKAAPMDEVMKLHQDEGVLHILHSLPTSRRKEKVNYFPTRQQQQQGHDTSSNRASLLGSMKSASSYQGGASGGSPLLSIAAQVAAQVSASSNAGFATGQRPSKKNVAKNNLMRLKGSVVPVSKEDLLTPKVLDLLKKLPEEDYLHLWSSTTRYKLAEEALTLSVARDQTDPAEQSSISPDSSVGSDISSASKLASTLEMLRQRPKRIGGRMLTNVTLISKQYKDILLRSYPTFTQILLCPSSSTGLKQSLGVSAMEELIDVFDLLRDRQDPSASAIMVTGMGNIFSQGVDLAALTHDGQLEKQRKAAESMASCIRRLTLTLLSYPKMTVAVVNGLAVGLAVSLLPYFDLVYASDRAAFRMDYARLGQIPEGFASVGLSPALAGSGAAREMVLLGREITAEEAEGCGIVTRVVWPDKMMEEVVPRMEELSQLSRRGVQATKAYMRECLKRRVSEVADEETRLLVKSWTGPDYAANLKKYLKTSEQVVFQ